MIEVVNSVIQGGTRRHFRAKTVVASRSEITSSNNSQENSHGQSSTQQKSMSKNFSWYQRWQANKNKKKTLIGDVIPNVGKELDSTS
jgi:SLT domain-containing protein